MTPKTDLAKLPFEWTPTPLQMNLYVWCHLVVPNYQVTPQILIKPRKKSEKAPISVHVVPKELMIAVTLLIMNNPYNMMN